MTTAVDPTQHDKFVLRQHVKLVINQYQFTLPGDDGEEDPAQPVAFVEQKRFKFKEDIRFYTDESKTTEVMRIKALQAFDPRAKYDITDAQGQKLGQIQKVFGKSLLRSTYRLFDANGYQACEATERNLGVALFRRLGGFIPYIGGFADWLPTPYHFVFTRGDHVLVHHTRRAWKLTDHYTIDCNSGF